MNQNLLSSNLGGYSLNSSFSMFLLAKCLKDGSKIDKYINKISLYVDVQEKSYLNISNAMKIHGERTIVASDSWCKYNLTWKKML